MIKKDNASIQYKNKYAFNSMQTMSNDYVKIIRIYAAAGHGKGFIDVILSFGVKSILHRDVVGLIKRFLKARKCANTSDLGTTKEWFTLILIRKLLTKEGPKEVKTIKGYMSIHLFRDQNSHGHRTLSDKKMLYLRHACIKTGHFVLHSIIEYHMWKII